MTTLKSFVTLCAVSALVLTGCQGPVEPAPEQPVEGVTEEGGQESETLPVDGDLWPLTGLPRDGADASAPALSAKIDNHPLARPQVGLDEADIVFEELVEGGLTRYVAVWHSSLPPEVGPVRSVRPMDPDIVSPLGGILAYSGGQQRFIEAMLDSPVASAIHGQSDVNDFFYRTSTAVAPHNVIVRAPELVAYFADREGPAPQFAYSPSVAESTAVVSGSEVTNLRVVFSSFQRPSWEWSAEAEAFLRHQPNGAADTASSGAQLSADNVVVLFVDIQVIQDIPTTNLIGEGRGFVATGGRVVEVNWSKAAKEAPIELTDGAGARVLLAPGQTWVELIPADTSGVQAGALELE